MDDSLKYIVPSLTAIISVVGTVLVAKFKSSTSRRLATTPKDVDLRVVHSTRVDNSESDASGGRLYKTRRYDRIRSPINGVVNVVNDGIVISNSSYKITIIGCISMVADNVTIMCSEDIGIVNRIVNGEGRLNVMIEEITRPVE